MRRMFCGSDRGEAELTAGQAAPAPGQALGDLAELLRRPGRPGADSTSGKPLSPASRSRGVDRHLAEQRHRCAGQPRQRVRDRLPATRPEDVDPLVAVRAGQVGHVLDHADHPLVQLRRERARPAPRPRPRRAAGVVTTISSLPGTRCAAEIATSPVPGGRSSSRMSRSPQYTSARNCCSSRCRIGPRSGSGSLPVLEHPAGDGRDAVRGRRHDHLLDLSGPGGDAQHPRHRVPVDVGVQQADLQAGGRERDRQVDGDGGLADPALAAGDRVHLGQRAGLGERYLLLRRPAAQPCPAAPGAAPRSSRPARPAPRSRPRACSRRRSRPW